MTLWQVASEICYILKACRFEVDAIKNNDRLRAVVVRALDARPGCDDLFDRRLVLIGLDRVLRQRWR